MTKYIDRYYLNGEEYGIKFAGGGGWQPGANTLLYIPMDTASGTTDQSNYHRTYTTGGLTHTTLNGVDCYQVSNGYIDLGISAASWLVPATHTFTAHFWVRFNSATTYCSVFQGAVENSYLSGIELDTDSKVKFLGGKPGVDEFRIPSTSTISANTWYMLSWTVGSGVDTWYVNGVSQGTYSGGTNYGFGAWHISGQQGIRIFQARVGNDPFSGYAGAVLMEDIERSAAEVLDYYNQTKSLYGIV